jgi:ATP-dependent Clp protease ATP-binding subunit ClpC
LSRESKRVLAYAAEEAERAKSGPLTTKHLLLGIMREQGTVAAKIMTENGVDVVQLRQMGEGLPDVTPVNPMPSIPRSRAPVTNEYPDLTAAANRGELNPLIGREKELESIVRILSRRTKRNPVLIGEPGVGKTALVHGLAQRIDDGLVPESLAGRPVLAVDASSLVSRGKHAANATPSDAILYVHGLFDLAGKGLGWGALEAIHALEPQLTSSGVQCIATGTPLGYRMTMEKAESLARHFEVVAVVPPGEEEAIRIVSGVKEQYEKFHDVIISDEAIETAVSASRWFLRHRQLPDRAIDLIDEAGASVKLRRKKEPRAIAVIEKQIRLIVREMEKAIVSHDFEKARACSASEKEERQHMQRVREELKLETPSNAVSAKDIVEAVAGRAGVASSVVMSVMQVKNVEQLRLVANELAGRISIGGRDWTDALVAYLAGCSSEEAEQIATAIRAAKARIDLIGSGSA